MIDSSYFTPIIPITPLTPLAPIESVGPLKGLEALEPTGQQSVGMDFQQYLSKALADLNTLQIDANEQATLLLTGEVEDFHTPIIALEKANLALGLAVSVRNQVIQAYQEIMRMQI